jgi:hypothetical protein
MPKPPKKKKAGRPPLGAAKRSVRVVVLLTPDEWSAFERAAERLRVTTVELARVRLLGTK